MSCPNIGKSQKFPTDWLKNIIGLAITAAFVYILLQQVNINQMTALLSRVSVTLIGFALCFVYTACLVRAFRWWFLLRSIENKMTWSMCIRPYFVGLAVNNILPLRAGDVIRMFYFRHTQIINPAQVLATLVLERIFDFISMLIILVIIFRMVSFITIPFYLAHFIKLLLMVSVICLLSALILPRYIKNSMMWFERSLFSQRHAWILKLINHVYGFIDALQLIRSPKRFVGLLLLSLVAWLLEGVIYLLAAVALHYQNSLFEPYYAASIGALSTLLPSSPGNIGTFDYFTTLVFHSFNVPLAMAEAFAVLVHLILWLPVSVVGFLFFVNWLMFWVKKKKRVNSELII